MKVARLLIAKRTPICNNGMISVSPAGYVNCLPKLTTSFLGKNPEFLTGEWDLKLVPPRMVAILDQSF